MNLRIVLRMLIATEIVLAIALIAFELSFEHRLPSELRAYLNERSEQWTTNDLGFLWAGAPLFLGLVIGWIGLWRLWRPARLIYTLFWLAFLPLGLLSGPSVTSGLGSALGELSTLSAGAILGIIYCSDLRHAFKHKVA